MESSVIVAIFGTIITLGQLIVAGIVGWAADKNGKAIVEIGRQQAENAEAKLRLDLFERRFEQYALIDSVFDEFYRSFSFPPSSFAKLHKASEMCRFLLDESIGEYIQELIKKAAAHVAAVDALESSRTGGALSENEVYKYAQEKAEITRYFTSEFTNFQQRFLKYMKIFPDPRDISASAIGADLLATEHELKTAKK